MVAPASRFSKTADTGMRVFVNTHCRLIEQFGFSRVRIAGSHRIYAHPAIQELVNLQDVGGEAKPYQIRQVLRLIERYNLQLEDA